jgi:23S rRNA pseudouridine2605 synthase
MMPEERLQKIIARSGMCSRRDADQMIADGRVTVDGQLAKSGQKADPSTVRIKVDGKQLKPPQPLRHFLLYKPRAVMTTCDDPEGRKTVLDLVSGTVRERVYPVGRLDYHSEGLLILTNDGALAEHIAHPRHGIVREYLVKIRGDLSDTEFRKLMAGTVVDGVGVRPLSAKCDSKRRGGASTWWRIQVAEGRTHEVRELFFAAGHPVQRLRRVAIGPLRDNTLKPGEFRTVTEAEIRALKRAASESRGRTRRGRPKSAARRAGKRPTKGPRKKR